MNIKHITDVSKEKQTDELKLLIYKQIEQFVYKYQPRYYPSYNGEQKELVYDLFEEFCRPKKHRDGETYSELDRLDPSLVGNGQWTASQEKAIATYTQRFVTHSLIDKSRTDKHEKSLSENYDENHGGLTIDRAAQGKGGSDDGMVGGAYIENMNYRFRDLMENPIALKKAKQNLLNDPKQVKYIHSLVKHYGDKLDPEVLEFIEKFVGTPEEPIEEKEDFSEVENKGVRVQKYKLQGRPALKLAFSDKDAMNNADKDAILALLPDYDFYRANGTNWYLFKKQ